jgi:hypothetical protein
MSLFQNDPQRLNMKKVFVVVVSLILITSTIVKGQHGNRQAGLRMGYRGGLFYQITQEAGNAEIGYNGLLSFNNNGVQLTGLRIVYETSLGGISPDLFFAWGYGAHTGFIYTDHVGFLGERYYFSHDRFCPVFGADGWLAAEYRVHDIPLNISLNLKPFVELTVPGFVRIMPVDLAVSISYVF